ncbi:hypothetical protein EYR40_006874 [Pleurotus pulmonarius]|nr:hypothetical protein EYR40_006874 [Pleurotus pulmonarius]
MDSRLQVLRLVSDQQGDEGGTSAEAECVPVLIGCLAGELFGVHLQPRRPAPGVPLPALLILAAIAVGYMIVIPCTRCTSSITATNRATNGHRFVFHSSEIVGTERHYIEDEPGVIPYDPYIPFVTSQPPSTSTPMRPGHLPPVSPERSEPSIAYPSPPPSAHESTPSPFRFHSPHASATLENPHTSVPSQFAYAVPPPPFVMPYNHPGHVSIESKDTPPPSRKLNAGDVLFWHHLARHGEIPGVMEDKRARRASSACDDHREDGARVSELGVKLSSRGKKMIFFDR